MSKKTGLELLREPFPEHQISKLPKPTKAQTDELRADFKAGIRCTICGGWHHPKVVHLDYVGHAALTDRLLDADPSWYWEPLSIINGLPVMDGQGGMWIKITVCGVTRLGYGHAGDKTGGDAVKEIIGDALRNAAMRFGAALDLWHKGELHIEPEKSGPSAPITPTTGAWDNITEDMTIYLTDLSKEVKSWLESGNVSAALERLEEANLDAEHKTALWTLLDSKERSALKREHEKQAK